MKKFLIALLVTVTALSITVGDAEARRLGGGSSIGRQSQSYGRSAPMQSPSSNQYQNQNQARPAPSPTPQPMQPRPASPWKNILGGALLGLGLGALLSHFGLGGAFANVIGAFLMIALLVFAVGFVMRLFRRNQTRPQPAAYNAYGNGDGGNYARTPEIGSRLEPSAHPMVIDAEPVSRGVGYNTIPADLDVPSFLRHAKTYFIRLQAAWDKADINDIREFTTTEMFAEIRMELQERGASPNHTDVVSLDAELLGVETIGTDYMASVKFSGMIKEAENAPAAPFAEMWNLTKPVSGQGGWVLAGIQQLSYA